MQPGTKTLCVFKRVGRRLDPSWQAEKALQTLGNFAFLGIANSNPIPTILQHRSCTIEIPSDSLTQPAKQALSFDEAICACGCQRVGRKSLIPSAAERGQCKTPRLYNSGLRMRKLHRFDRFRGMQFTPELLNKLSYLACSIDLGLFVFPRVILSLG